MRMCINRKVVGGLAGVGLVVLLVAPGAVVGMLPLLIMAACPLSMMFMMRTKSAPEASLTSAAAEQSPAGDEVARLRAEVDRLRAQQGRPDGASARVTRPTSSTVSD
jgi:hypothetical protein